MRQKLRAIPQPISLVKLAYKQLRDSIMTFRLKPGQIYNEINLAKEFGISMTPVREALLELSARGLVTFLPRRGVRINHFSKRDVEEVFELRKAIELAEVEKISRRSADLDVAKLERTLDRHIEAIRKADRLVFLRADRTFHTTLAKLTQNRRLVSILGNIGDMIQMMGVEGPMRPGRMEEVLEEHQSVLKFIRQTREAEARQAMDYHLDRSKEAVLEQHHPQIKHAKRD